MSQPQKFLYIFRCQQREHVVLLHRSMLAVQESLSSQAELIKLASNFNYFDFKHFKSLNMFWFLEISLSNCWTVIFYIVQYTKRRAMYACIMNVWSSLYFTNFPLFFCSSFILISFDAPQQLRFLFEVLGVVCMNQKIIAPDWNVDDPSPLFLSSNMFSYYLPPYFFGLPLLLSLLLYI